MKWQLLITVLGCVSGINLRNINLTDVPSDIPATETWLNLQKNKISVIRLNAFVDLMELKMLLLDGNTIHTIEPGAFNGLMRLNTLSLARNKLTTFFDISMLSSLSVLQYLYVGGNINMRFVDATQLGVLGYLSELGLGWIPLLDINPFPNLSKLRKLNLQGNGMTTISSELLKRLSGLEILWLGYNKFSSLPELGGV